MGYSLSWAAVKGGDIQTVCSVLGLRSTNMREELSESKFDGVQLPTGWYLVVSNTNVIEDRLLKELSHSGDVVYCFVEDHVMFSSSSGWKNGRQIWQVTHDGGEKGHFHLEMSGDLPVAFEGICKTLLDKQTAAEEQKVKVDYIYDTPAELAKQLTGFRHDEDISGMSGEIFEILEPAKDSGAAKAGSFLSRLFAKKDRS